MSTPLARVLDPAALDVLDGRSACVDIVVPDGWVADGSQVEFTLPLRVTCARCDGGGCDSCDRSGAFRLSEASADRCVTLVVPPKVPSKLRLAEPLADGTLALLQVGVRAGPEPSRGLKRIAPRRRRAAVTQPASSVAPIPWLLIAAGVILALLLAVVMR